MEAWREIAFDGCSPMSRDAEAGSDVVGVEVENYLHE